LRKAWLWLGRERTVNTLGFFLALGTAISGVWAYHEKDVHDRQSELAASIRRLEELNLKSFEMNRAQSPDYVTLDLLNAQRHSTLQSAGTLALGLGSRADAAQLTTLAGLIVWNTADFQKGRQLVTQALANAQTAFDESAALRLSGMLTLATSGDREAARKLFERALQLKDKYPDVARTEDMVQWLFVAAQLDWSAALARIDCDEARRHFAAAVEALEKVPPMHPTFGPQHFAVAGVFENGIGGIGACMPHPRP
jgi:tetratricopeptide (TPR) repeat protein